MILSFSLKMCFKYMHCSTPYHKSQNRDIKGIYHKLSPCVTADSCTRNSIFQERPSLFLCLYKNILTQGGKKCVDLQRLHWYIMPLEKRYPFYGGLFYNLLKIKLEPDFCRIPEALQRNTVENHLLDNL